MAELCHANFPHKSALKSQANHVMILVALSVHL